MDHLDSNELTDHEQPPSWWLLPLRLLAFAFSMFFLLPIEFYRVYGSGRDPNWQIALHYAYENNWIFGKDIIFTYGPLGFLHSRLAYPGFAHIIGAWDVFSYLLLSVVLAVCLQNLRKPSELFSTVILCACLGIPSQPLDTSILFLFFSLFFISCFSKTNLLFFGILAWVCSCLAFYIKVSTGNIALSAVFVVSGILLLFGKRKKNTLISLTVGLVVFFAMAKLLPVSLIPYWQYSLELIKGYPEAMFKVDANNRHFLSMAVVVLLFFGLSVIFCLRSLVRHPANLLSASLAGGLLFVLFKQGFVRADGHIFIFFQYIPLVLAMIYCLLETSDKSKFKIFAVLTLAFSFAAQPIHFSYDYFPKKFELINNYLNTFAVQAPAGHVPTGHTRIKPLSSDLLNQIQDASVDVVTFQSYSLIQSKTKYTPRPVFHSYAAYTPKLDQANSEFFNSDKAPKFVLYSHVRIDDRYPFFDESMSRISLRRWYQPVGQSDGYLILERQVDPKELVLQESNMQSSSLQKLTDIPDSDLAIYLKAKLEYTFAGKLIRFFYRPPPCYIELVLESGHRIRARAIPQQLSNGVLINKLIRSRDDVATFMDGNTASLQNIRSFRIESSWPWGVNKNYDYSFSELIPTNHHQTPGQQ